MARSARIAATSLNTDETSGPTWVVTDEDARRLGIPGSPTVRVDGQDLEGLKALVGSVS